MKKISHYLCVVFFSGNKMKT